MAKTQGKVSFYLKEPKSKGITAIRATFCYNNMQMKYYEPKLSITPKFWNTKEQKARELKEFPYTSFNANLKALANCIVDEYQKFKLENNNLQPTKDQLKERVSQARNKGTNLKGYVKQDLFGFLDTYLNEIHKKINSATGKQISPITIRAYKQTFRLLKEYKDHSKKYLDFENVDTDFYNFFTYYLTHEKGFKLNTVGKHLRNVKTFLQEALDRNLTNNINFRKKSFRVVSEKTDAIYLNDAELKEFEKLDLKAMPRLERARDLFLVGCYSGLRFSDFSKIQAHNIMGEYIEIEQQKTGAKVTIPIHPTVEMIMAKYAKNTLNSLPRSISNQKMNNYLKEVAQKITSLHTPITIGNTIRGKKIYKTLPKYEMVVTHTARRSFATNQFLKGVPTHFIMQLTGHKTEKAFLRYLKIENKDAAIHVNNFWKQEQSILKAV